MRCTLLATKLLIALALERELQYWTASLKLEWRVKKINFCWCLRYQTHCLGLIICTLGGVPSTFSFWKEMRLSSGNVKVESNEKTDSEFPFSSSQLLCLCKVTVIPCTYFLICIIGITVTDLLWSSDKSFDCTAIKMAGITVTAVGRDGNGLYWSHSTEKLGFMPPEISSYSLENVNIFFFLSNCVLSFKVSQVCLDIFKMSWRSLLEFWCFFVMKTWVFL